MITGTKTKNKTRTGVRNRANTAAATTTNNNNKPPWSKNYLSGSEFWLTLAVSRDPLAIQVTHPEISIDSLPLHCWLNFCWKHIKHFIGFGGVSSCYFVLWGLGNPPWKSWPNWSHNGPWSSFMEVMMWLMSESIYAGGDLSIRGRMHLEFADKLIMTYDSATTWTVFAWFNMAGPGRFMFLTHF